MKPVTATEEDIYVQNQNKGRAYMTGDYKHGFLFPLLSMVSLKFTVKGHRHCVMSELLFHRKKRVGTGRHGYREKPIKI